MEMLFSAGAKPKSVRDWSLVDKELIRKLFVEFHLDANIYDEKGETCLHFCARKSLSDEVSLLLICGANVNAKDNNGYIPLYFALHGLSLDVVELLLPDSNLNLVPPRVDPRGGTALHVVTRRQVHPTSPEYLARLIDLGVPLDAKDEKENTALEQAVWNRDFPSTRVLLDAGCNVNAANSDGDTALTRLTWYGDGNRDDVCAKDEAAMCKLLIQAGADVNIVNETEIPPVMNAAISCNLPMLRHLLQANATLNTGSWIHTDQQGSEYEDDIPKFMTAAVDNNAEDCARFILGDSCRTSVDQEFFYQLSLQPEVNAGALGLTRPPLSLFRKCRLAIRASLPQGPAFLNAVDQLKLPILIKEFLVLRK